MNNDNKDANPAYATGLTSENLPAVAHAATHIPNFVWVDPSTLDHVIASQGVPTPLNSSTSTTGTYDFPSGTSPHPPMTIPIRDGSTSSKDVPIYSQKMEKSAPPPPLSQMPTTSSRASESTERSASQPSTDDHRALFTENAPRSSLSLSPKAYVPTSNSAATKSKSATEKRTPNAAKGATTGPSNRAKDSTTGSAHTTEGVAASVVREAVDVGNVAVPILRDVAIGTATIATQVAVGTAVIAVDIASVAVQSVPIAIEKALGAAHEVVHATKEAYNDTKHVVAPANLALKTDWSDPVDFTFRKQRTPNWLLDLEDNERRYRTRRGADPILMGKHARFVLKPLHAKFRASQALGAKEVSHPWTSFAGKVLGNAAHVVHDAALAPAHMVQTAIGQMGEERGDIAVDLDMVEEKERNRRMNTTVDPVQSAYKRHVERELLGEITPKTAL